MALIQGPIVMKSTPERKVFGPVLIPDKPDLDGDIVSAEKIRQVHDLFNEKYGNIDVQHSLQNVGKVYESYIAPTNLPFQVDGVQVVYPKGTWMIGVKVTDDQAWSLVEQDKLKGFSIMAVNPALKGNVSKSDGGRVTLNDLGADWIVNAVSLVDTPAVPDSRYIVIKSAGEGTVWDKVMKGLQSLINLISSDKAEPQTQPQEDNSIQ
jgi:hypothetical protein